MINTVYRLTSQRVIEPCYVDCDNTNKIVCRPQFLAFCHADQRYFQGLRPESIMRKKLPMALFHECCARVIYDPRNILQANTLVALIPNIAGIQEGIYENYAVGSAFRSSGVDGFSSEYVYSDYDRLIELPQSIPPELAAITEFVSIATHAYTRFNKSAHNRREHIAIWGDGSLAYTLAVVLTLLMPQSNIHVIGRHSAKLNYFSFVHKTWHAYDISCHINQHATPLFDHVFDCTGGAGSREALDLAIKCVYPQAHIMLMGVSEEPVEIRTRDVLEKGISMVGCSRSGLEDFMQACHVLEHTLAQERLMRIISVLDPVRTIDELKQAFDIDRQNVFKTVIPWQL